MPVSVSQVLGQAQIALNDIAGKRWPVPDLFDYFKAGLIDLALEKPTAFAGTAQLDMVAGTSQTLPDEFTALIRLVRNVPKPPYMNGRAITHVERKALDAQTLGWHDPQKMPQSPIVLHSAADLANPRGFHVFPGNDGTGTVEAIVGLVPVMPDAGEDANDASTYTASAIVDDVWSGALLEYVLYRAHAKTMMLSGNAALASAHYGQYAAAIGKKVTAEGLASLNTSRSAQERD